MKCVGNDTQFFSQFFKSFDNESFLTPIILHHDNIYIHQSACEVSIFESLSIAEKRTNSDFTMLFKIIISIACYITGNSN